MSSSGTLLLRASCTTNVVRGFSKSCYLYTKSPFERAIEDESLTQAIGLLSKLQVPYSYRKSSAKASYAVLVPFCHNEQKEPCLLLTQRSATMRTDRGMIAFPGGLQDESDTEDHVTTALRETHEEIGVDPSKIKTHGVGSCFSTRNNMGVIYPVVGRINLDFDSKDGGPFYLNRDEVQAVHLIPLKDLCDTNNWRYTRWKRPGTSMSIALPVYRDNLLNDNGIPRMWGITAVITHFVLSAILPQEYKFHFDILAPLVQSDVPEEA